ncbi:molybdopterin synthase catalytic subunit MoaE [Psychromonas sp. 14N.309.X.WAT.B.A12]|uniref:molybdopterin synthase catalytic subunit MoaE n=1 Tax=unclassified Psychromonas TaxID=2614957 RepID=UPI0025AEE43F|nr:molybdopterin synthase catalytic subunit MoaE [Psychromonas sp. 14N.309.X.WAT.B.A12]MDN2663201.1 molybdopterin synthase catalytic subunit MoaE [Psychromonas sp. 14N.309.X.WAT.B.A12]
MISVQEQDFNQQVEYERLRCQSSIGAIVTFTGLVRDINDGHTVSDLSLEHYPGMTEKCLVDIVEKAKVRWNIIASTVIHRVGHLTINDQIVFVGIASQHRGDAFAACEFIMDYLKTEAPFWKKETMEGGETKWVDARESDQKTLSKWAL